MCIKCKSTWCEQRVCRFWNITSNNFCISFPRALARPSKHVQSNYFRCARSSIFSAWIISTLRAWTSNDDEKFSALLSTEFEVLLAWRMDIRRLHWKALQTVDWITHGIPPPCLLQDTSSLLSCSDQRLMYCPAGTVCLYTAFTLPCSIGEERACIETRSVQSENVSHLSTGNAVFHFWHLFSYWGANSWLDKQFQPKKSVGRLSVVSGLFGQEYSVQIK